MKKKIAVLFSVFAMVFISCDQDFNTIGADLVGDEHFDFDKYEVQGLKAYSKPTGEVQTNNLPINPLGFYNNPVFGQTKANFVTQLSLAVSQPKFGTSVQVENVTLYIPYFSKVKTINSDGSKVYSLDSIYGADLESKMKLSVYENGYYINGLDPNNNFETSQRYFSDGSSNGTVIDFDNLKRGNDGSGNSVQNGTRLNDSPNTAENDQFFFNKEEIVVYKTKLNTSGILEYVDADGNILTNQTDVALRVVKERLAPGIYLSLNRDFFKKKILDASASNLFNNNDFRQYFKGLYFKMEQNVGEEGAMAMLNFNTAKLNINFSSVDEGATAGTAATSKTFIINAGLNAAGSTVSLQNFTPSLDYSTGLGLSNPVTGSDANLYVKGGNGSVVFLDVFGDDEVDLNTNNDDGILGNTADPSYNNGIPDELDVLKRKGWLINDAYLEFYIDKSKMTANSKYQEAERLYLYDATNQKALVDYSYDSSTSSSAKRSKVVHGGIIERDDTSDKKGVKYKIRITQHINNLLNSTNENFNKNVKLGLCVTENIALTGNYYYKTPMAFSSGPNIEFFPVSSIIAQQGVVLHGTASVDPAKKLKLTIHFTKPN